MGVPTIDTGPMTVEDFYLFTDAQTDDGKWELFDGEPFLTATPAYIHQKIVGNVLVGLGTQLRERASSWNAIPGIGVLVSNTSRPEPDVMIVPGLSAGLDPRARDTKEAVALFEVLSPSTSKCDLKWKRIAYTGMPALAHYIVIAPDKVEVIVFARDHEFVEQRLRSLDDFVDMSGLDVTLPMTEIYRDTGLS